MGYPKYWAFASEVIEGCVPSIRVCILTEGLYCALNDRVCMGLSLSSPFGSSSSSLLSFVISSCVGGANSFLFLTLVIRVTLSNSLSLSGVLLLLVKYFDVRIIGTDVNAAATTWLWVLVLVLVLVLRKWLPSLLNANVDAVASDSIFRFVTFFLLCIVLHPPRTTITYLLLKLDLAQKY